MYCTSLGSFDPTTGKVTLENDEVCCPDDLVPLGHLSSVEDCVVPCSPAVGTGCLNREIAVWSEDEGATTRLLSPGAVVGRPSDEIEHLRRQWISRQRSSGAAETRGTVVPLSTVGILWRTSSGGEVVTYDPSGHFHWYNSHRVAFEAHRPMDVLVLMVAFLKHNGLWGGSTALMSLDRFDYATCFFDPSWGGSVSSEVYDFSAERRQFALAYERCERDLQNSAWNSNKRYRPCPPETTPGSAGCAHDCEYLHVALSGESAATQRSCVACFSQFFFAAPFDVDASPAGWSAARVKIAGWLSRAEKLSAAASTERVAGVLEGLAGLVRKKLGPLAEGRSWNWPEEMDGDLLCEYVTHTLARCLNAASVRASRALAGSADAAVLDVEPALLYSLMNPFGRMLLLFVENGGALQPPDGNGWSVVRGRFFDVVIPAGRSLWSFQLGPGEIAAVKAGEGGCLETRRQLPFDASDARCPKRLLYRAACRGEGLAQAGEILSDVAQTTARLQQRLNNREFSADAAGIVTSRAALADEVVSLECAGYRPVRSPGTKNGGRVSGRVSLLLGTRVGARIWHSPSLGALVAENVSSSPELSAEATARAAAHNRVFYYDIETTGLDPCAPDALVTAVCGTLCTGGDAERGERVVFGLATSTGTPERLAEAVRECYRRDDRRGSPTSERPHVTETLPDRVSTYASEVELLVGWGEYLRDADPHITCGWNSSGFDDFYVFATVVRHLTEPPWGIRRDPLRASTAEQRLRLARGGMYDLSAFVDPESGYLHPCAETDLKHAIARHAGSARSTFCRGGAAGFGAASELSVVAGGLATCLRLDMMQVCARAYGEQLSEFNLNAMVKKVSRDADKEAVLKDAVDLKFHLLGYAERTPEDQAVVLRYCSKDAHLVAVVSSELNKEATIFKLCEESGLGPATVVSHLDRPLIIIDGAINRSMGARRAARRGCGIRRHSLATDTKGGMVAQPLVEQVPCQTVDLSSLYPSLMHDNNLCTTTFATHAQVVELRNRRVWARMREVGAERPSLAIMDAANAEVLARYRCVDIVVAGWAAVRADANAPPTLLERDLGFSWWPDDGGAGDGRSPNQLGQLGGLDYAPEVPCSGEIQMAAYSGDDAHVQPTGLEYLVPVLPILAWESARVAAHVTAGECGDAERLWDLMERDFDAASDERLRRTRCAAVGGRGPADRGVVDPVARRLQALGFRPGHRLAVLCERIARRVYAHDSAGDEAVVRWATRTIDVGAYCRTWNATRDVLPGVVPAMQLRYRAQRVEKKALAKRYRDTDPVLAEMNDVEEKVLKLSMNSIYGILALRSHTRTEVKESEWRRAMSHGQLARANAAGGVGGGTRHAPMANQITQLARRVFANIGASLRQFLPNVKQAYGDTDSTFLVHNIPGDGDETAVENGRAYLLVDLRLKAKLAKLIPAVINCSTKGIAGGVMMNIEHERLALMTHLPAKKTYHMLHLNESSPVCRALFDGVARAEGRPAASSDPLGGGASKLGKLARVVDAPAYARGYVVPHNPAPILGLASSGRGQVSEVLRKAGVDDERSLGRWLTSSPKWVAFDLEAIRDFYATRMLDAAEWTSARTARAVDDPAHAERIAAAAEIFTVYLKGAFVKRGIAPAAKIKNLQAVFDRADALASGELPPYEMEEHARNCASFQVSPALAVTSARVRTFRPGRQNLPNPSAMAINNHLNPSNRIGTDEKFLCVTGVSGRALALDEGEEVPPGYYVSPTVRWNPKRMIGLVAGHAVRNLSVVPNNVKSLYDMVATNSKVLANMHGDRTRARFAVPPGALCFSTGITVADVVARAVACASAGRDSRTAVTVPEAAGYDDDGDGDGDGERHDGGYGREREAGSENPPQNSWLREEVDPRVKTQLDFVCQQLGRAKATVERKRGGSSKLDDLVAAVEVKPSLLFRRAAERMAAHEKQCKSLAPVSDLDEERAVVHVLELVGGLAGCTATCVQACCQALDFVTLYCVTLKMENESIGRGEGEKYVLDKVFPDEPVLRQRARRALATCRDKRLVERTFQSKFNRDANAVVYLMENSQHGILADHLVAAATCRDSPYRSSDATGDIWDPENRFYFGELEGEAQRMRGLAESGTQTKLPFFTGVYHARVLEVVASCLRALRIGIE